MADWFVNSAATGANNGTSKTNAWTSANSVTGMSGGDRLLIAHTHSETTFSGWTLPVGLLQVISMNFSTDQYQAGARLESSTTTLTTVSLAGCEAEFRGIEFAVTGSATRELRLVSGTTGSAVFNDCNLYADGTGISFITMTGNQCTVVLNGCRYKFGSASNGRVNVPIGATLVINGGAIASGSASISRFIEPGQGSRVEVRDFDFTNAPSSMNLCNNVGASAQAQFLRCRLPAGWSGVPHSGTRNRFARVQMYNCDNAATNYRAWVSPYRGDIRSETTIVRTGGATDGTTPISWKLDTTQGEGVSETHATLVTDWIAIWNETTGSAKTITLEALIDSATALTNAEMWIEVSGLATSGAPLGTIVSTRRASSLATPATLTSSAVAWTTTGMTNVQKRKISASVTPQIKGFIYVRAFFARSAAVAYVCPKAEIA